MSFVSVLRATSDLRAGQAIGAGVIRTELLPRSKMPAGALTRIDDASKVRLKRDVSADQVLVNDDLPRIPVDSKLFFYPGARQVGGITFGSRGVGGVGNQPLTLPARGRRWRGAPDEGDATAPTLTE